MKIVEIEYHEKGQENLEVVTLYQVMLPQKRNIENISNATSSDEFEEYHIYSNRTITTKIYAKSIPSETTSKKRRILIEEDEPKSNSSSTNKFEEIDE